MCPLQTHLQPMVADEAAARRSVDWITAAVVTPGGALFGVPSGGAVRGVTSGVTVRASAVSPPLFMLSVLSLNLSPFTDAILLTSRDFEGSCARIFCSL